MVAYFCGGMAGSALAATVYSVRGWSGVAEAGLAVAVLGLAVWLAETGLPAARRHIITSKIQKRHEPQEASP
jgi:hypothetical protein